MRKPTLAHRFQHLAYRLVLWLLRLVPENWALKAGAGVGWTAGVVFGFRKKIVQEHLRQAFPDKNDAWRRRVLHDSFRHLGREGLATFLLSGLSKDEIMARTEVDGLEALQEAVAQGKGVILATGHFGNWEIGGAGLAVRGLPLDIIVQHQRNPLFDRDLNRNRTRLGLRLIMRGDAPKETLRALRKGRVVGIAGDQNRRRDGVFVDFFGKQAATARGAAVFALRTGAPLFLGVSRRLEGKIARYRWSIEPVEYLATGEMEEDVLRLTQAHTAHLEREIIRTPDQYLWQHRRWKTQPPEA
jgi:KDO2-lipid IV(A) lauroyltransferase